MTRNRIAGYRTESALTLRGLRRAGESEVDIQSLQSNSDDLVHVDGKAIATVCGRDLALLLRNLKRGGVDEIAALRRLNKDRDAADRLLVILGVDDPFDRNLGLRDRGAA